MSELKTKLFGDSYLYWLPGSYVNWDCNGFKSLGIKGKVELSKDKFVAVDPETGVEKGQVTTTFTVEASGLNKLLVSLSFTPFKIIGFDEAYFSFKKLTLDYSDTSNPLGFVLPTNYPGGYTGEMANLWRGFYVEEAEIVLSGKFKKQDGSSTRFGARKLLLDEYGMTGLVGASNLLTLDQGTLGNWKMSVKNISLEFFTGDFKSLKLNGEVLVSGIDSPMKYDAYADASKNYHFGIQPTSDVNFNVFSAKISLAPTSSITVDVKDKKFVPTALLNGDITFNCAKSEGDGAKLLTIPNIKFEGLRISTAAPVFDINYVALASSSDNSFNKFPLTLKSISYGKKDKGISEFNFDLLLNLAPSNELAISASTNIGVQAIITDGSFKYKGLSLNKMHVEAKLKGAFDITGELVFADGDETYGNGFRGAIDAVFVETIAVKVIAVFGNVNGYRYFFVDGFASNGKTGIPAPPFTINGFGGGLFYKMRQSNKPSEGSDFGEALSGIRYVPDNKNWLGFKASLAAGVVNPSLVNARLDFEIFFTSSYGIQLIGFNGEATIIAPPTEMLPDDVKALAQASAKGEKPAPDKSSAMRVTMRMKRDFEQNIFHAEIEMFVNVAGLIKGTGANDSAGKGVLHIEPSKWYYHLGTPSLPAGITYFGLAKVNAYFMAGHDLPTELPVNSKLDAILKESPNKGGNRNQNVLNTGKGLTFGASLEIDTGDLNFLIFYGHFNLGLGFDLMLIDEGPLAACANSIGTKGINGWYGKGQIYAYVDGAIGLKAKIFGKTRQYEILAIQAGAALRMEGPNPTWMKGVVGGKYNLLGGLIKGNCRFEMTAGSKCIERTVDLKDLSIIADLTPKNSADKVDLFAMPQAVFTMPVGKTINISDDPNLKQQFRINLAEFKVYAPNGSEYPGQAEWNADHTSVAMRMHNIFDKSTTYKLVTKVSFEELVNNTWQAYKGDDGKVYYETRESSFTTGPLPEKIDKNAIAYSYPLDRMVNFYKGEYNKAYVAFNPGVLPFFSNTPGYVQKARWKQVNGPTLYSALAYNDQTRTVEADVPASLVNEKIYRFELVHVPTATSSSVDRNVNVTQEEAVKEDDGNTANITVRKAEGSISNSEEIAFYSIPFRCSKYNTFLEKFATNQIYVMSLKNYDYYVAMPEGEFNSDEFLDKYETTGYGNKAPLVQREAVMANADWYQANYGYLLYNNYPFHQDTRINDRVVNLLGLPPTKNIDIEQNNANYLLTDEDIATGRVQLSSCSTYFIYTLTKTWRDDYMEIRNRLANLVKTGYVPDAKENTIIKGHPWPQVSSGNYPIELKYVLPGKTAPSSSKVVNIKNNIK